MDGTFTYQQIKDLQELICPPKDDSDSDSDYEGLKQRFSRRKITPGDIGKPNNTKTSKKSKDIQKSDVKQEEIVNDVNNIWHPKEVNTIKNLQVEDLRKIPEYEMKFKQAVGTEDIFLGINMKTPGTASCEWITLKVKLPSEKREKIELSVESNVVDIRSPIYRLQLPTPFPVDPNTSSAKWHPETECLEITLKLTRELDDVNF